MLKLDKWIIKDIDNFTFVVDDPSSKRQAYEAPYGDFLKAYMDHLNVFWWKKGKKWKETEVKMREILNQNTISWVDKNV